MISSTFTETIHSDTFCPEIFMDNILTNKYPAFFDKLNIILEKIICLEPDNINFPVNVLAQKVYTELDRMFIKEKFVLFPYIRKLIKTEMKSEHCTAFKNVKQHYTSVLSYTTQCKQLLKEHADADSPAIVVLITNVAAFESDLIGLQIKKEKWLIAPVKSCSGCRLIKQ